VALAVDGLAAVGAVASPALGVVCSTADQADLAAVDHELRQVVNLKGT
jgi:hypothetical protein